ncbi:pregnancy-specific glycoprotein 22-like [Cricetulus griseus]|uniref:Pregnancy-specific glycoprotein 22-like n=1 Tax=Cricetulus griseus TaxID=10029 RepID=A0A9J7GJ66_CRIGR|nr:pregnancy-specific glycoprotein 22-like [Cricetulus griseus]
MEGSSVLFFKGCTPWQGLLFTASLFMPWHLCTTAHVTVDSVPPLVAEGDDILFLVHDLPENLIVFAWFKGLTNSTQDIALYILHNNLSQPGPAHSGRETIYRNGSLLFEKVTRKDTGFYTLKTYNRYRQMVSTTTMYLNVHAFLWKCGRPPTSAQPTIESVPPSVAEGGNVLLLVHNPPENIVGFVWFKGKIDSKNLLATHHLPERRPTVWGPAHSGRETVHSDGSLLLRDVTQEDSGLYTLQIVRTDTQLEQAQVQLQVNTSFSVFCNTLPSSQLTIQTVPPYAFEGEDILLQVHNLPEDLITFSWYKSEYETSVLKIIEYTRSTNSISWGPEHQRRGMVYSNGSLLLQHVTEKDAGMYTLEILKKDFTVEKENVEFHVKKHVTQPFVQVTDTTVAGHRSVIFTCVSPNTDVFIRWIFNKENLQLTERITLSPTKCGLRIDPVGIEDAGDYQCEVSNGFSLKTSPPVSWP